jgi:predicted RNase H-like HicB family nuclease
LARSSFWQSRCLFCHKNGNSDAENIGRSSVFSGIFPEPDGIDWVWRIDGVVPLLGLSVGGKDDGCYAESMDLALTAVFRKVPEGYIGFVEELPGANTQAATLEEAREGLREAVHLVLQANRELAQEENKDADVIREELRTAAG